MPKLLLKFWFIFLKAIHGYRETERRHWYPHNRAIINRVKDVSYINENTPYVHVLDLAQEGVIKPHVDSVRVWL